MDKKLPGITKRTIAMRTAVAHLKMGPLTSTQVGAALYGKEHRKWQAYARPGGKLLHHMKRLGIVTQYYDGRHFFLWKLLPGWEAKLEAVTD